MGRAAKLRKARKVVKGMAKIRTNLPQSYFDDGWKLRQMPDVRIGGVYLPIYDKDDSSYANRAQAAESIARTLGLGILIDVKEKTITLTSSEEQIPRHIRDNCLVIEPRHNITDLL